jgi:hypothetical protein
VKDSLASWLHGVAHRVAARARVDAARRRRHEQRLAEARGPACEALPDRARSEAGAILSEEIARLPETYRAPVVLCYLEAMSYQAAAASLGVSEDTVRGRLARARERLRRSLARRGVEVPALVASARPPVIVRPALVRATARAAAGLDVFSRSVISLCERTIPIMTLTRLKISAAVLVLGVVAAGAIVSAQPPGGGGPSEAATRTPRPTRGAAARAGHFIVDWIPADGKGGKKEITVDPTRHAVHLPWVSQKRDDRPNDGAVRLDLERGKFYKVTAAGEAFMSEQTGANADPFPGVVVLYPTDEEDCYAERQIVLAPGKSITFRSPWLISPNDDVTLMAFFLDDYTGGSKRGSYTLTIEETGEPDGAKAAEQLLRKTRIEKPGDPASQRLYEVLISQIRDLNLEPLKRTQDHARPGEAARDRAKSSP